MNIRFAGLHETLSEKKCYILSQQKIIKIHGDVYLESGKLRQKVQEFQGQSGLQKILSKKAETSNK